MSLAFARARRVPAALGARDAPCILTVRCFNGRSAQDLVQRPGCVPDAQGFGCDEVRMRGTFFARSRYLADAQ